MTPLGLAALPGGLHPLARFQGQREEITAGRLGRITGGSCRRWLGVVVFCLSRVRRWRLDSSPGVDGVLERVESRHLANHIGRWHSLQGSSEMLDAMEHLIFCCDRQLCEVLMPEFCRVQDHQRAAALGHHALPTIVLK